MALEKELATFNARLPELKAEHEGKYVLIHGDDVVDVFSSYDDAIKAGYEKFNLKPFLVKQVHSVEQVQFVTRLMDACPTSWTCRTSVSRSIPAVHCSMSSSV